MKLEIGLNMTRPINRRFVEDHSTESQKKLLTGMSEILFILTDEMEKVDQTIDSIKSNPKPDIEYMTMPLKLKCYRDGLKFAFKIITKYKQMESLMDDGK